MLKDVLESGDNGEPMPGLNGEPSSSSTIFAQQLRSLQEVLDCGDYVVVTNARHIKVTGHKDKQLVYLLPPASTQCSLPTITGLASALDALHNPNFGITYYEDAEMRPATPVVDGVKAPAKLSAAIQYRQDYGALVQRLRPSYPPISEDFKSSAVTVFLAGSTGYLRVHVAWHIVGREDNHVVDLRPIPVSGGERDVITWITLI
ncbi:uncharacterized protein EDB93DRAFT_1107658 [Suillus bovinus]|uniref:uncharacterized protein n=1 Tax=Suillus bovinus TaxID=48563 RepID=UPI001B861465|nr:uncharacterized protein EDB93DRAFT_1107658 [Suillus bovinus]KAG2133193.1 hypothetical protein EDB93DRAFT_1107658 [Suillus bovinus]